MAQWVLGEEPELIPTRIPLLIKSSQTQAQPVELHLLFNTNSGPTSDWNEALRIFFCIVLL